MKIRYLLFLFIAPISLVAQTIFQKTFGGNSWDIANGVQICPDQGFIVTGYVRSFGDYHMCLVKLDKNGFHEWSKSFGKDPGNEAFSVEVCNDGGFALCGTGGFGQPWDGDIYKTDACGAIVWSGSVDGTGGDDYAWCIRQTKDSGFVIVGTTEIFGNQLNQVFLLKLDKMGAMQWSKTFGTDNVHERGYSVEQTADNGYIIACDIVNFDCSLIKADSLGNLQWWYSYPGGNRLKAVHQTGDKGYIAAGYNANGSQDVFLLKVDSNGTALWEKYYSGPGWFMANDLKITSDRGFIITGISNAFSSSQDLLLIKTDSLGVLDWAFGYGGPNADRGNAVVQTYDGGYLAVGQSTGYFSLTQEDWLVVKTDSIGTVGCFSYSIVPTVSSLVPSQIAITNTSVATITYTVANPILGNPFTATGLICQPFLDTLNNPLLSFASAPDTICAGQSVNFVNTSQGTYSSYSWIFPGGIPSSSSSSNPGNIVYAAAGTYTVTLIGYNTLSCLSNDTVTMSITVVNGPTANAGPSVTITSGDSTILSAGGGGTYSWSTGETTQNITVSPTTTTSYCVQVTNSAGCTDTACVTVYVNDSLPPSPPCQDLFVPSAFSPNGDGVNDVLYVHGTCIKTMNFAIFDRWGEKVFATTDPTQGWDGKYENEFMNNAVFVYYLDVILDSNKPVTLKGDIVLVR